MLGSEQKDDTPPSVSASGRPLSSGLVPRPGYLRSRATCGYAAQRQTDAIVRSETHGNRVSMDLCARR